MAEKKQEDNLQELLQRARDNEEEIHEIISVGGNFSGEFEKPDISLSEFKNCRFSDSVLRDGSFVDNEFIGCDFSGTSFENSYFMRCKFRNCRLTGSNFAECGIRNCSFSGCAMNYSNFDKASLRDVKAENCDFTEATLQEVKLKSFVPKECRFISTGFFRTPLSGIDFSDSDFIAPTLSNPPTELKGAKVNTFQAVGLASLLGIKITDQ